MTKVASNIEIELEKLPNLDNHERSALDEELGQVAWNIAEEISRRGSHTEEDLMRAEISYNENGSLRQMVYLVGRGTLEYFTGPEPEEAIFYAEKLGEDFRCKQVKAMPVSRLRSLEIL